MAVPAALPRAPVGVMIARHNMVDQLRQTGRGLRYHQTAADWIATRLGEPKASFFEHHQSSFPRTAGAWSPLCIEPGRATA